MTTDLWAGGEALEEEVVTLLQPDVHGSHGLVAVGGGESFLLFKSMLKKLRPAYDINKNICDYVTE